MDDFDFAFTWIILLSKLIFRRSIFVWKARLNDGSISFGWMNAVLSLSAIHPMDLIKSVFQMHAASNHLRFQLQHGRF